MNETYEVITSTVNRKKTRNLGKQIGELIDGHDAATIVSVLVPLLVEVNLHNHIEEDDLICKTCAMAGLTELLQAIRRINEETIEEIDNAN